VRSLVMSSSTPTDRQGKVYVMIDDSPNDMLDRLATSVSPNSQKTLVRPCLPDHLYGISTPDGCAAIHATIKVCPCRFRMDESGRYYTTRGLASLGHKRSWTFSGL
jgi:hypothetical protein